MATLIESRKIGLTRENQHHSAVRDIAKDLSALTVIGLATGRLLVHIHQEPAAIAP
jgi:hypothetical protein